jgi:hypothetical protein
MLTQRLAPRDQVRLCVRGDCRQVHGVRVFGDSVSAVPYFKAPTCDSCEIHYALRDLGAVQTRGVDRDKTIVFVIVLSPVLLLFYAISHFPST